MSADPLEDIKRRLTDIEQVLWPPGGPGNPTVFEEKIKALEEKIEQLEGKYVTKDIVEDLLDVVKLLKVQPRKEAASSKARDSGSGNATASG